MHVMVFGTFDKLHPGHLNYFKQAWNFAFHQSKLLIDDSLEILVIVARDNNVLRTKGRQPQEAERSRLHQVRLALRNLDLPGRAILGNQADRWQMIRKYRPEFIGLGYDQVVDMPALKSLVVTEGFFCKIKRLEPYHPEKYKSSYNR